MSSPRRVFHSTRYSIQKTSGWSVKRAHRPSPWAFFAGGFAMAHSQLDLLSILVELIFSPTFAILLPPSSKLEPPGRCSHQLPPGSFPVIKTILEKNPSQVLLSGVLFLTCWFKESVQKELSLSFPPFSFFFQNFFNLFCLCPFTTIAFSFPPPLGIALE